MTMPSDFQTLKDLDKTCIIQAIKDLCKKYKVADDIPNKFWSELNRLIVDCQLAKAFEDDRKGWLALKEQFGKTVASHKKMDKALKNLAPEVYIYVHTFVSQGGESAINRKLQKGKYSGARDIGNPSIYNYDLIDARDANSTIDNLIYLTSRLREIDAIIDRLKKSGKGNKPTASRSNFIIGLAHLLRKHFRITVTMGSNAYEEYKHPFADLLDATICKVLALERLDTCKYAVKQLQLMKTKK